MDGVDHGNLMPIGRFAKSCRLGVKALRHYDELGLLAPAFVDPSSGYRYYHRGQARAAVMIGMLRSLDLPLPVIRRALAADPGQLRALIGEQAARLEAELAQRRRALLSLRHLAEHGALASTAVEVRREPARRVARRVLHTDSERLIEDTTSAIFALLAEVAASELTLREPVFTLNDFGDGEGPIEITVCAEVAGEARGLAGAEVVELPGGAFAMLRHVGPYETLGLAHHALLAWAQERGHAARVPVWELYRNDPREVPAEDLITDVALPLR